MVNGLIKLGHVVDAHPIVIHHLLPPSIPMSVVEVAMIL